MSNHIENIELSLQNLNSEIVKNPTDVSLLEKRAMLYYKSSQFHAAYNDFVAILTVDDSNSRALQYLQLLKMVMNHEYRENLNV
ncbi:MAG: hypothetical protein R3Y50_08630 [Rikenellaceae bacterium]